MEERELYTAVLGIIEPWLISKVELNKSTEEVEIHIEARVKEGMACPDCG